VFDIQDGAGYTDLIISSEISGSSANQWKKTGTGVLQLTGNINTFSRPVSITAGTLLANNTTATSSATGQGVVTVSGGATLGGAGYIGGGYSTAAVNLSNGSSSSRATLAPGSISNTTGDALIGTLTIGTAAQANNVTFGTYAQLLAQVGNAGSNDRLTIYGDLNLSAANDLMGIQQVSGTTLAGEYVLASFTGTLTGRFDSSTLNGGSLGTYQLEYRNSAGTPILTTDPITGGGSIVLAIPEPASATLAMASLVGVLAFRRRST
jgi:fibronectin-binding autotransporter adhesin